MILIIGAEDELHSKYIYDKLVAKGEQVAYFDSRKTPENILLSWNASDKEFSNGYFVIENRKIYFSDVKSVYWRNHYGYSQDNAKDPMLKYFLDKEIKSAYSSIFASSNWLWCNSLYAIELHKHKTHQLNLMVQNNIRVPKTLITNDKNYVEQFVLKNNGNVIFKPIQGGAYTEKLTKENLSEEMLDTLKNSPVQFQEMIEGVDIRVYLIGNEVFAAKIEANTLDFRVDKNAKITPVDLPKHIIEQCFLIAKLFDLNYTGIDIRLSNDGEYVFIEANPAPMFIGFEKNSGLPISDALVKLLIR